MLRTGGWSGQAHLNTKTQLLDTGNLALTLLRPKGRGAGRQRSICKAPNSEQGAFLGLKHLFGWRVVNGSTDLAAKVWSRLQGPVYHLKIWVLSEEEGKTLKSLCFFKIKLYLCIIYCLKKTHNLTVVNLAIQTDCKLFEGKSCVLNSFDFLSV